MPYAKGDIARAYLRQGEQRRRDHDRRENEDRLGRDEMPAGAHGRRGDAAADRCEARIAADPLAQGGVAHEAEADGRDRRTDDATRCRMQGAGAEYDREDRPHRNGNRAQAYCDDGDANDHARGTHGIDKRAAWHLAGQGNKTAGGEDEADVDLRP